MLNAPSPSTVSSIVPLPVVVEVVVVERIHCLGYARQRQYINVSSYLLGLLCPLGQGSLCFFFIATAAAAIFAI